MQPLFVKVLYSKSTETERLSATQELDKYFNALNEMNEGPYFCGERPTLGDVSLAIHLIIPLMLFPRIKYDPFKGRDKLNAWFEKMKLDPDFKAIQEETLQAFSLFRENSKKNSSKL